MFDGYVLRKVFKIFRQEQEINFSHEVSFTEIQFSA